MNAIARHISRYRFSLMIIAAILYLSFFKPPQTSLSEITNFDKMVHFGMYFGLSALIWIEYLVSHARCSRMRLLLGAVLMPIVLSGAIELAQKYLTTWRGGEWWDFASNTAGVLTAGIILSLIARKKKKNANRAG